MAEAEDKSQGVKAAPATEPYLGFKETVKRTIAKSPGSYAMGIVGFGLLIYIILVISTKLMESPTLLRDLADPAHARGIITFMISFTAIGVGLLLILQSLFGTTKPDQYRQAREIYAGLMGILGTIVGFYFGSAEKSVPPLTLAEPRYSGQEVMTLASGGVGPYRYHVTPDSLSDSTAMGERVSQDGWIRHKAKYGRPDTLDLTITVWDSKNTQVSKKLEPGESGKPAKAAKPAKPADTAAAGGNSQPKDSTGTGTGGSHFPKGK